MRKKEEETRGEVSVNREGAHTHTRLTSNIASQQRRRGQGKQAGRTT